MGFKEVQSLNTDVVIALGGVNKETGKPNPKKAEGYFLGSRSVASKRSKTGFSSIHVLQTPSGNLGIWGKTDLDNKLSGVTPGTAVRITQTGKVAIPGKNDMYTYKVEFDSENTIEVATPTNNAAAQSTAEDYASASAAASSEDEDYGSDEDLNDEPAAVDEVIANRSSGKRASAVDSARQAKVQELLNGGRKRA